MKKILQYFAIGALLAGIAVPAFAQTATSTSASDLIKQLQAQIQTLNAQLQTLIQAQSNVTTSTQNIQGTLKLLVNLRQGMSGDDVKLLQTILAADASIYPEATISGFYGNLTAQAVKRFQKKHGIEARGFVGLNTLKKLNKLLDEHPINSEDKDGDGKKEHCAIVPPGHLIAPGWLRKHGNEKPIVPPCQHLPPGIERPHTGTTTPEMPAVDTMPPVLSAISAMNIASTSATINWTTNEPATSKAYYGTASPLNLATAPFASDAALVTNHWLGLTGLTASTTYYFVAESKDAAMNTATSSQQSFTTIP